MRVFIVLVFSVIIILLSNSAFSQSVGISNAAITPDASSIFEVRATNKGVLITRVALTSAVDVATIAAPATSLLVYNTATAGVTPNDVSPGYYYWNGVQWVKFFTGPESEDWHLIGNAGTNPATNFLGTTDAQPLVLRTSNTEWARVQTDGTVCVGGTADNDSRLRVYVPSSNSTDEYSAYFQNYSTTSNFKYGLYNYVSGDGASGRYGISNYVYQNPASTSNAYGIYSSLSSYGTGVNYGNYIYHSTSGTGTHYGSLNYLYLSGASASSNTYASYNNMQVGTSTNPSIVYGEFTYMDYSVGTKYGEYKQFYTSSAYDAIKYGDYNEFSGTGDGTSYGVYNDFLLTGTGTRYGVYNDFPSATNNGTIYGLYNDIQNDGSSSKYGVRTYIAGGDGGLYGTSNSIYPATTNVSTIYGTYTYINNAGSGTHYGTYLSVAGDANDYAVYSYAGNNVFNESGGDYDFRVESDAQDDMFFVDASSNRIGINTTAPAGQIHFISTGENIWITQWDNSTAVGALTRFQHSNTANGSRVLMGTTNYDASAFQASGVIGLSLNNTTTGTGGIGVYGSANNESGNAVEGYLYYSGGYSGWAGYFNADVYSGGLYLGSDRRLKRDIKPIENALDIVMQIEPVEYYYDTEKYPYMGFDENRLSYGFVAQDLEVVVPTMVKEKNLNLHTEGMTTTDFQQKREVEQFKVVNYTLMIPILTQAVKEQQEEIESLEQRIEALEAIINASE